MEIALQTTGAPSRDRARFLVIAGIAALHAGDLATAGMRARAARDDIRTLADALLEAFAVALLAAVAAADGDGQRARRSADEAGAILGALNDDARSARSAR
jgi:hypothetical protein